MATSTSSPPPTTSPSGLKLLHALRDKTAVGVADFLFSLFCRHGWPERIISDQGTEFVNAVSRYSSTTHTIGSLIMC